MAFLQYDHHFIPDTRHYLAPFHSNNPIIIEIPATCDVIIQSLSNSSAALTEELGISTYGRHEATQFKILCRLILDTEQCFATNKIFFLRHIHSAHTRQITWPSPSSSALLTLHHRVIASWPTESYSSSSSSPIDCDLQKCTSTLACSSSSSPWPEHVWQGLSSVTCRKLFITFFAAVFMYDNISNSADW